MTQVIPVLNWQYNSFGGNIFQQGCSASVDNLWRFSMQGTDPNGDIVFPSWLVVDNINNNSTAKLSYGAVIGYSIAPFSRKKFPILRAQSSIDITVSLGTVVLTFTDFDPGIPDDLNQYALSSGSVFSSTTWDPVSNTSGVIALDLTNLTGTFSNPGPGVGGIVVGDVGKTAGKFYWEPKYIGGFVSAISFGLALSTIPKVPVTLALGADFNSIGFDPSGNTRINSLSVGNAWSNGAPAIGDSIRCAVNLTAGLWWAGKLGQNWNDSPTADPSTGTGGFSIATLTAGAKAVAMGCSQQQTFQFGCNFGASPFLNIIPAGFGPFS